MNFFKRAFWAVTRKRGRSVVMLILFFVIGNLILSGFAIQNATESSKKSAQAALGGTLTLSYNTQKAMEQQREQSAGTTAAEASGGKGFAQITQEPVTEAMAASIAANEHVSDYNYVVNTSAFARSFEAVTDGESMTAGGGKSGAQMPSGDGQQTEAQTAMADVTVTGVSASDLDSSFKSGAYTLKEGEAITQNTTTENGVMIEEQLASADGLKVGDTITLSATESGAETSLKIVGIYSSGSTSADTLRGMAMTQPANKLYVDYKTALSLKNQAAAEGGSTAGMGMMRNSTGIDSVVFYLDDPKSAEAVESFAKTTGIDLDKFSLSTDDAAYQSMAGSLDNLASFARILVIIVAVAGAGIMALVLVLFIKERMYETGVLMALGETKSKIMLQYLSEVLMIALVAFVLASFSGNVIAGQIGKMMVNQQTTSASANQGGPGGGQSGDMDQGQPGGSGSGSGGRLGGAVGGKAGTTTVATNIDVSVTPMTLLELYGLGMIIVLVATAAPCILVFRYNPQKILANAN